MVVTEWQNADIVFVVEATSNLSPYVESIKNNYILPTLEYFSGGPPDDRDYGLDNTYNCSLYAMVQFMTTEVAPGCATDCSCPTASSYRLMQFFDRIQFVGGGASSGSHITEGIATALQCFDDFQVIREKAGPGNSNVSKYCIFIVNSNPYATPACESVTYNGYMLDQLVGLMNERGINLSIISPRKIPYLFKMYERSGGDLQSALSKNYAKDRRHLVLLRGYQLQERPISPQQTELKPSPSPSLVTQGQKRPLSPASSTSSAASIVTTSNVLQPSNVASPNTQIRIPLTPHPHPVSFTQPGKTPNAENIVRPNSGASPVPRPPWNSSTSSGTSTPPVTAASPGPVANNQHLPVLTSQLSMAPIRSGTPTLPGQQQSIQVTPMLTQHQQPSLTPQQQQHMATQISLQQHQQILQSQSQQQNHPRTANPTTNQMRPVMIQQASRGTPSPYNTLPPPRSPLQQQSQLPQSTRSSVPSPLAQNVPSPMQQQLQSQNSVQQTVPQLNQLLEQGTVPTVQQSQQNPVLMKMDRKKIWAGIIEYQEKPVPPHNSANRITYTLQCQISCQIVNGDPEVNSEHWPDKLSLQLVPKQLITKLFHVLKLDSYHVGLHFTNHENEGFQKLSKIMSTNWVGCIQFQSTIIRMMIVLYMPEKKLYMGFIPHDQDAFFAKMREMINHHKNDQQQKQKQIMIPSPGGQQIIANPSAMGQTLAPQQSQVTRVQHPQMVHSLPQQSGPPLQIPVSATNFYQQLSGGSLQQPPVSQQITQTTTNPSFATVPVSGVRLANAVTGVMTQPLAQSQTSHQQQQPGPQQQANVLLNQVLGPVNPTIQQQILSQPQQPQMTPVSSQSQLVTNIQQFPSNALQQSNLTSLIQAQQAQTQDRPMTAIEAQERQRNLLKIQKLQQSLEAAQQKELQFQAAQQHDLPTAQQQQQQQSNTILVRQQLHQHIQNQQHNARIQLMQQQQQQQQQVAGVTSNPQLRHLLQQQQLRAPGPSQQQHQQTPNPQILLQQQMRLQQPALNQIPTQQQTTMNQMSTQQLQQRPQQQQQAQWDGTAILDLLQ